MVTFDAEVPEGQLSVLVIGAHLDDCEINFGGTAVKYRERGHEVTFVSMTNGAAGHHEIGGLELTRTRRAEAQAAADLTGIEYEFLDAHEGELQPTLENRNKVIRVVREVEPDLVFTHRPNDYHPDHRYTSVLVQDAAYMVTVPAICRDTPHLTYNPVICYLPDDFQKPTPLSPDIVVPIDDVVETKLDMVHQHESQVYEWLPYNTGKLDDVPADEACRREWLDGEYRPRFEAIADRFRDELVDQYGPTKGRAVECAEAFELCEYGGELTDDNRPVLFPFV
ncbi:PIG-L deacetylase family protein [Haloarchaeobius sp. TZWSO28]|uniref:PIG-L deacetylase family protein n=1 Tax=Haloarchaeobius sp. TZWSO28 TaxID=3446119 RepID=UPI003EC13A91